MKIKKNIQSIYKKECEKNVDLLLMRKEGKRHYFFIKIFSTFTYDHELYLGRKHFSCYYLQGFSTEEILKSHIKDCFKINGKQEIILAKKCKYGTFKNYERKIKLPFIIYADFESILEAENNVKQNPEGSYSNKSIFL